MCLSSAFSQKTITGKVTDTNQESLPGVSVVLKGVHGTGTFTDLDGTYQISIPSESSVLEFSFLGFTSQSVTVGNRQVINITLEEDLKELDEVVVVGYGAQKRIHMTGAVSQIGSKDLMKAPMQNVSNMLTGKIPGLTSIQRSGKPGDDGTALYIRGLNSFTGKSDNPMVIVDGVPRPIDYVNPNDIESISVLKDASAAIYGVQGANGVIVITTKAGGEGPAKISYDGSVTLTQNTAMPEMLNAADYMYWHNKARTMDGLTPIWTADIQNKVMNNDPNSIWGQTDWLDKIFRTGIMQQHNISASGGTDKTKYYASIGIMDQEGTMRNTSFTRYNIRTNLDVQVAKNLKFTANLAGYRSDRKWPGTAISNQGEFNPVRQAINSIPIIKSDYNGYPVAWNGATYYVNGYAALTESGYKRQSKWNLDSNFKLEYDFSDITGALKGLKMSIFGAYNYSNTIDSSYDRYYELYYVNQYLDEGVGGANGFNPENSYEKSASWGDTWLVRPQIDYSREFDKHFVGATLAFEAKKSYSNTMTGRKTGYYSDEPVDLSLGSTLPETPITGSHTYSGGQLSWIGRLNYAYGGKYLAEAAFRYDGSYIFAPGNRWGFFPSTSLGWVISEEDFFRDILPNIDYLKLRASYGKTGNDAVDPFQHNSLFAMANNSMVLGNKAIAQFYSTNAYVYSNLTWASTHNYNLGLDFDMWNRKLGLELNVFYKLTKDILEEQSGNYPTSLGGYYPKYQNSGKVENKGIEITLKHQNQINSDWSYSLRGDFAFARNKVLSRIISDNRPNYRAVVGQSIGARYGFNALGLFQSQEEIDNYPAAPSGQLRLGDIKYQDVNGDGIISSTYDYVKTGYGAIPEINFALNMELSYKNFYLTMLWQGVTHTDYELSGVYDSGTTSSTVYTATFPENGNSPYYRILDAWTPENTNAKYPRLSTVSNGNNAWQSTWWVVNGEYLRLKNANIGYNIPAKLLRKTPFSHVNIYLAGTNLLTLSHFKYVDPESPSVSNGYYPQQKTFSFGVNVTF
ncbi:TonB-linked SusC/RagA family outer membrane protein [Dysgonomonas hofstadii]|uniref:TonB-linked SusC/RagA family outer membrane protein n=1 Tax=Dysgonomonas hofstadii TaxID=637886 RepID=A0A840CTM7_9BACT|nr:TonB-dependent receptor [Dysgonomonas hofstadii]MBB4038039.1 TonB-linked SusC/RagA family outer membrane protein [Dysgonomonas hofstadii]